MKKILSVILLFASFCTYCCGQADSQKDISLGIDISSAICFGTLRSSFSYGWSRRWSVGADIGVDFRCIAEGLGKTQAEHWESLSLDPYGTTDDADFRQSFITLSLYTRYWPVTVFRGPWLSIGGVIKDRDNADISAGLGYCIPIWKGLRADIVANFGIIDTYKNRKLPTDGIRIMISYVF